MKIIIAERLVDEEYYEKLNFIGKTIFDFKFDYVFERLSPLLDELEKEENINDKAKILLTMEADDINDFIAINGYSKELSDKISGCFTPEDAIYFEQKLYQLGGENSAN